MAAFLLRKSSRNVRNKPRYSAIYFTKKFWE